MTNQEALNLLHAKNFDVRSWYFWAPTSQGGSVWMRAPKKKGPADPEVSPFTGEHKAFHSTLVHICTLDHKNVDYLKVGFIEEDACMECGLVVLNV